MKNQDILLVVPTITKADLVADVMYLVNTDFMGYAEAVCHICEDRGIDPSDIAKVVDGPLKNKLEAEAIKKNIIKSNTIKLF
jgi:hypothetical protein